MPFAYGNTWNSYNNYNNWNFNNWNTASSWPMYTTWNTATTSSQPKKEKTLSEIREERRKKALEELKKKEENKKLLEETNLKIEELEQAKKQGDEIIEKGKNGTIVEDGVIKVTETMEDYKKLSFWKKALRAGSNYVQGNWKLATGFIGYETDPKTGESKWSWKKCLKNTAIAGGCIALTALPVVGPFIGGALLATGVISGAVGIGKGIYKAATAKTPREIDEGWQDIGAGVTIGVASAVGLRGLGKAAQTAAATSSSAATASSASAATTTTSATGSASASSGSSSLLSGLWNSVKMFAKDSIVNAFKATKTAAQADKSNIAANGFFKTWGTNIKNFIPKLGKSKYENGKNTVNQEFDQSINSITKRLDEIRNVDLQAIKNQPNYKNTPEYQALKDEYMLLRNQKTFLEAQKAELNNTFTQNGFRQLGRESKAHKEAEFWKNATSKLEKDGFVDIPTNSGGNYRIKLNADKSNLKTFQNLQKSSKKIAKQMEKLAALRKSTMWKMASRKDMASDVELYTGTSRTNRLGRMWDVTKPQKADLSWKNVLTSPFTFTLQALAIPFKPWAFLQSSPTTTFYKLEETFIPMYEQDLILGSFADQLKMGAQTLKMEVRGKNEAGEIVKQETIVTKDMLAQLEESKKEYDAALAKLKEEQKKLTVA